MVEHCGERRLFGRRARIAEAPGRTRLAAFAFLASCRTVGNIKSLSLIPFPHQQSKAAFVARMQNVELQPSARPLPPDSRRLFSSCPR